MQITAEELATALHPVRQMKGRACELAAVGPINEDWEYVGPPSVIEREDGALSVTLRLIRYDIVERDGAEEMTVRDIKEQEISLVPLAHRDEPERVRAYLEGWAAAVSEVLAGWSDAQAERTMPYDLVNGRVLKLARAETAEDFKRALLMKSRLGKLLQK